MVDWKNDEEQILLYPIEELLANRFSRYASYVLLDRAIPDARDGLKPVQRRILYAMADLKLTADREYKKAARVVGETIGKYHPHGDTSVYAALVRMSQKWKLMWPLVDMQGNNGSIDGDSAAAMRYTEVKLSSIAHFLLADLKKDVVKFTANFDETEKEPVVLPGYFPNLLVNGATGIAVGLATNIPPHNLHEVIDAVIMRIKKSNCTVSDLMKVIKGPDFPTGGIIQGISGIKNAYETGRGKIVIAAKTTIEHDNAKKNVASLKKRIVIHEIPYEVLKQDLIKRLEEACWAKNAVPGIKEIRDETDRQGLRIVVELNNDAEPEQVLNYLLKTTNLQINYHLNLVAIVNNRPKLLNLLAILDHYIAHQVQIITNRTSYELHAKEKRLEILQGLIITLQDIDRLIVIIRNSPNRDTAKNNLIATWKLTDLQAEAIIQLRLYRLTAADMQALIIEKVQIVAEINCLKKILSDRAILDQEIIKALEAIKNQFPDHRHSIINGEIKEIIIDQRALVKASNLLLTISYDGWIKVINPKLCNENLPLAALGRKPTDLFIAQTIFNNLLHDLLLISNKGNYIIISGHMLIEQKWKDVGVHLNNWCKLDNAEKIIMATIIEQFDTEQYLVLVTKSTIKKVSVKKLATTRTCRPLNCIRLAASDELIAATIATTTSDYVVISTASGLTNKYPITMVPLLGLKAQGVKALKLDRNDVIVGAVCANSNDIYGLITDHGTFKRIPVNTLESGNRMKKGQKVLKIPKNKNIKVIATFIATDGLQFNYLTNKEKWEILAMETVSVTAIGEGYGKVVADNIISASSLKMDKIA